MDSMSLDALQARLGYRFAQPALLETALTHPSYGDDHHVPHYQRLEFLGDAVFELAASHMLYEGFAQMGEGQLTRLRAAMVREESLSQVARALELGPAIRLSVGEAKAGGADKPSILCDVCEAVVAAVYLDGGFDAARALVQRLLSGRMPRPGEDALDDKSRLQEALQRAGRGSPTYQLLSQGGPDHDPVFTMCALLEGQAIGQGSGRSKRAAQQAAARQALVNLAESGIIPGRKGNSCV